MNYTVDVVADIFPECNFLIQMKTKVTNDLFWVVDKLDKYPFSKTKYYWKKCGSYGTCSDGVNSNAIRKYRHEHPEEQENSHITEIDIVSNALLYIVFKNIPFSNWNDPLFKNMFQFNLPSINFSEYLKYTKEKIFKYIKNIISKKEYLSLTYDEWEDLRGRRFLAIVLIHYNENELSFSVISHKHFEQQNYTAKAISDYIRKKLIKLDAQNKVLFVT